MQVLINTDANPSNALVRADRRPAPLRNLVFGDTVNLELGFIDGSGSSVTFPSNTLVNVGVGSPSLLLGFSNNFAPSGTAFWTGSLNLSTSALSGAFNSRDILKTLFEVETVASGVPKTWVQQEIAILNQILASPVTTLALPYYYTAAQVDALVPSGSVLTGAGNVSLSRVGSAVIISGQLNQRLFSASIPSGTSGLPLTWTSLGSVPRVQLLAAFTGDSQWNVYPRAVTASGCSGLFGGIVTENGGTLYGFAAL